MQRLAKLATNAQGLWWKSAMKPLWMILIGNFGSLALLRSVPRWPGCGGVGLSLSLKDLPRVLFNTGGVAGQQRIPGMMPFRSTSFAAADRIFDTYRLLWSAQTRVFGERGRPDRRVRRPAERSSAAVLAHEARIRVHFVFLGCALLILILILILISTIRAEAAEIMISIKRETQESEMHPRGSGWRFRPCSTRVGGIRSSSV